MTTASIASFPLMVGSSVLSLAGYGARWSAGQFMRSPMASTTLVLVTGLTLIAGANALYMQDAPHPAPLFGTAVQQTQSPPQVEPVVVKPVARPEGLEAEPAPVVQPASANEVARQSLPETSATEQQSSQGNAAEAQVSIGNEDIATMQEKLKALGLFDGTVDGFYGPKTADAIRAFEQRNGLPKTGAATPQVIEAVRAAPLTTSESSAPVQQPVERFDVASNGDIGALIAEMDQESPAAGPAVLPQASTDVQAAERPSADPAEGAVAEPSSLASMDTPARTTEASVPSALDRDLISDIQRGLSRLGFLQGVVSGTADTDTARAIRKFQIFNNYSPTGEVSPAVYEMLVEAGAYM